ncbi:Phage head-tail adapter protein [Bordetella tumbae]|uniref:head-tail adaptor protein n=1 Tax=Bordetella tumbae TaxID=1649139 RepID=UPI0039F06176
MLSYRLRHRITFERPVHIKNEETGSVRTVWEVAIVGGKPMVDVPAEVLTGAGRELMAADARQAQTTARINLRWFPVDRLELAKWRILWDGRQLGIVSAETDITARREWRLRCEDGVRDKT